jgi:hypothetical protein
MQSNVPNKRFIISRNHVFTKGEAYANVTKTPPQQVGEVEPWTYNSGYNLGWPDPYVSSMHLRGSRSFAALRELRQFPELKCV